MKDKELKKLIKEAEAQSKKEQTQTNKKEEIKEIQNRTAEIRKAQRECEGYMSLSSNDYEVLDQMEVILKRRKKIRKLFISCLYALPILLAGLFCFLSMEASQSVLANLAKKVMVENNNTAYAFIEKHFLWVFEICPFIVLGVSIVFYSLAYFNFYGDREYKYLHQDEVLRKRIFPYIVLALAVIYLIVSLAVCSSDMLAGNYYVVNGELNKFVFESFKFYRNEMLFTTLSFTASLVLMTILGRLSHKVYDFFSRKIKKYS